jgi:hypothetical protein
MAMVVPVLLSGSEEKIQRKEKRDLIKIRPAEMKLQRSKDVQYLIRSKMMGYEKTC